MKKVIKECLLRKLLVPRRCSRLLKRLKISIQIKIDEITLSIHNENNGNYEEELPYEPISKGKIIVTYDSESWQYEYCT